MRTFLVALAAAALPAFHTAPGADLPVVRTHEYVMSGAVRPLLFWISRDDVGIARITWRAGVDGARGYSLLIGTDPDRAPRGINRWGFISEETDGAGGSVLALMTGSHDTSYRAEASASTDAASDFHLMRSRSSGGTVAWQQARLRTPDPLTVYQLPDTLARLRRDGGPDPGFQRTLHNGVRPGFLVAVAGMLDEAVAAATASSDPVSVDPVRYAFGRHTYELRLRDARRTTAPAGDRRLPALHTRFESRALDTGDTSSFEITAALSGGLRGVPLLIQWQPRWWLRVRLRLAADRQ